MAIDGLTVDCEFDTLLMVVLTAVFDRCGYSRCGIEANT